MSSFDQKILNALVERKALDAAGAEQIVKKAEQANVSVEEVILGEVKISPDDFLQLKSELSGVSSWKMPEGYEASSDLLRQIPEDAAKQYQFVPLEQKEGTLLVGMVNPQDLNAQEALRFVMLRSPLVPSAVVIIQEDFKKILGRYKDVAREVSNALAGFEAEIEGEKELKEEVAPAEVFKEAPIIKIATVILKHAVEGKASDIHIEPLQEQTRVRFRVEGQMFTGLLLPSTVHNAVVARIKILGGMRIDESRIPQDGRFHMELDGAEVDFRVSTFPTTFGEKVVMRVLTAATALRDLPALGLMNKNLSLVQQALLLPYGMILVSGPTGSGKSTTLYALLNLLPKEKVNVVTLEDPVEYRIEGFNQSEIKEEIGYTFASGLRNILRQDPDIIMVGEIRDEETAELATHAALTGHLMFSTIHTNNAVGVIPRLVDMGVDAYLLPSALALALAQRLLRKLCEYCRNQEEALPAIAKIIDEEVAKLPQDVRETINIKKPIMIWRAPGCTQCGRTGYKGRIGVFEVLPISEEIKKIISEGTVQEWRVVEEARREGFVTLRQDGIIKALQGLVTIEDALQFGKAEEAA
ncbi:MAG: type II/IV secretion system protein [Candidatus Spechtbacteria bacterium]|nr:type II/IV secretion system protein [Candidatus Spechtbacteria bacterium]